MKILGHGEFGYLRTLPFDMEHGGEIMSICLRYEGQSSALKGCNLDNEIIPFIVKAVNSHDDLVLTLMSAIERVRMANDCGDPILSAWREDAEKLLSRVTSE